MAEKEWNNTHLVALTKVDPGTVGDFLNGKRWPKIGTQGKIEKAIGWEAGTAGIGAADWLAEHVPPSAFVYRSNSLVNQSIAAKAGVGITLLPCYLGDSEAGLARALAAPITEIAGELWIVTHVDLKQTARVRAFFDLVGEALIRERDLFEGRRL